MAARLRQRQAITISGERRSSRWCLPQIVGFGRGARAPQQVRSIPTSRRRYIGTVDLGAVKAAPGCVLAQGAVAAARNACGLVEDAELLFRTGRRARAYSLAGLAVEEVGKADCLAALAAMPEKVRARAPIGRMLEWHQLKLVVGQLTASVPFCGPS